MPAPSVQEALRSVFGFDSFRAGQAEVIDSLMAGRSALAIFPTGGGKSLCYQLPALHFGGLTLVVSPLIALMKDQIDFLVSRGIAAARLDSSLEWTEARKAYDELRAGRLKLLYVAPERFKNERFVQRLRCRAISLMVIDEAHCISEWGHNFRPDYLKLGQLARDLGVERVLALTATATPQVAEDILRGFGIDKKDYVNTGFYRPNLVLRITPCRGEDRDELLVNRLREREPGPAVVYVTLQRTAEHVADLLRVRGFDARAYHAGMNSEDRNAVQDWFMPSARGIVAATIAFGMGIDKADIRYVYHYNVPKGLEHYSQELGRAGRDGDESTCELFACADDVVTLQNFSYGDTPAPEAVGSLVSEVLGRGETFDVSLYELSVAHDIRILVVATILTYLELEGVIAATAPFYNLYRFQPQRSSQELLARFDERRARFLRELFVRARKGRTWLTIDLAEAARAMGEERRRIIAALNHLEERGELLLKTEGLRQGYRVVNRPRDLEGLVRRLADRFLGAEKRDIARIDRVIELARRRGCIVRGLLSYFGEKLGRDCGHCCWCLGEESRPLPPARKATLGETEERIVRSLREEGHAALATPRQLARFLCGLSSPATSRSRPPLTRHPHFGACDTIPFHMVLQFVE